MKVGWGWGGWFGVGDAVVVGEEGLSLSLSAVEGTRRIVAFWGKGAG